MPLDTWTIANLKVIEDYIVKQLPCERYKPLWLRNAMHVNISKYCTLKMEHADGSMSPIEKWESLGKGTYCFFVHVSHVYKGPHKDGHSCSLSLFASEIIYRPDSPAKPRRKRALKKNLIASN